MRVMSFNLRTAEASDGENAWDLRREMALERVRAFTPDLLGLQECHDLRQADEVRAGLPEYTFIGARRGGGGRGPLGMTPALGGPGRL